MDKMEVTSFQRITNKSLSISYTLGNLFLSTWININPNMGNQSHVQQKTGLNYFSFSHLKRLHLWCLEIDKYFNPTLYDEYNYLSLLKFANEHVFLYYIFF